MRRPTVVNIHAGDPYDIYIGRGGSRDQGFGNPFRITAERTRDQAVAQFEHWVKTSQAPAAVEIRRRLPELAGLRLGCWCAPARCHGDVLADLAEALPETARRSA